ncbi:MAG: AraC family transcriptional regulator [Gemmatimonadota bacterium]|jgi:AraC-like DNA-binding protein
MILSYVSDPLLLQAVRRAAHPGEDVVHDPRLAEEALAWGYPRLVVASPGDVGVPAAPGPECGLPVLQLTHSMVTRWEAERRAQPVPGSRMTFLVRRLGDLMEDTATRVWWVDRTLGDLGRATGAPLPPALRGFARRVLEFPSHYVDLHSVADVCGLSRGALKARFRRRNLPSPYGYLRWFRVLAAAYTLSDRSVTVAQAARRLGFTSDGNLCRTMTSITGLTPTKVRSSEGWNRLLISFAWAYLHSDARAAWMDLDDLFLRQVA